MCVCSILFYSKTMEVKMMMANKPVTEEGDVRQEPKLVALIAHNNMNEAVGMMSSDTRGLGRV